MKIRILPSALDDLAEGRMFYQKQAPALGVYFLDSLLADIDFLAFLWWNSSEVVRLFQGVFKTISLRHLLSDRYGGDSGLASFRLPPRPALDSEPVESMSRVPVETILVSVINPKGTTGTSPVFSRAGSVWPTTGTVAGFSTSVSLR